MTALEVLCVGEGLAVLEMASDRLTEPLSAPLHAGGAEANVARHLAAQGIRAGWSSRVGDDPFGRFVVATLANSGVDTASVEVDASASTGFYVKETTPHGVSTMHYYRSHSAASRMDVGDLARFPVQGTAWVHVSGITAAISRSAARMVDALIDTAHVHGSRVSFDVNFRPRLWGSADEASDSLHGLAQRADLVFVGRDEAEALWAVPTTEDVFTLLDRPGLVVVKDGDVGATEEDRTSGLRTFVPTLAVDVVELVGAGDAFAGGYLAGMMRGEGAPDRLARGHASAAWTIGDVGDVRSGHNPAPFMSRSKGAVR